MAISSVSGSGFSILTLQSRLQNFQADQLARDQAATRNRFSQKVDAQRRVGSEWAALRASFSDSQGRGEMSDVTSISIPRKLNVIGVVKKSIIYAKSKCLSHLLLDS